MDSEVVEAAAGIVAHEGHRLELDPLFQAAQTIRETRRRVWAGWWRLRCWWASLPPTAQHQYLELGVIFAVCLADSLARGRDGRR